MKNHSNEAGLTLIEVLVSALILSFLVIGITGVLNIGNLAFPVDMALVELQQQARQALFSMTKELRKAVDMNESCITTIDADSDQITFNTIDGSTGVKFYRDISDVNSDGIVDQVIREYPSGTRKILANDIARLKFSFVASVIKIEIRADRVLRQQTLSFPLTEKVRLRNE